MTLRTAHGTVRDNRLVVVIAHAPWHEIQAPAPGVRRMAYTIHASVESRSGSRLRERAA